MKIDGVYISVGDKDREMLADMFDLDVKDTKHFKRNVERWLEKLGYTQEQYIWQGRGKGLTITWIPETPEEKIEYLVRALGIDERVDVRAFATFVYALLRDLDIQGLPWAEKEKYVQENYGIDVSLPTLKRWADKLKDMGEITTDKTQYKWWCSYKVNGETVREEINATDPELQQYQEDIKQMYSTGQLDFGTLWDKYGCKYYKSYYLTFGAWHSELIDELLNVVEEYLEALE